jgi:hypothetical protein
MKKKKRNGTTNHDLERLTPLITVNEPDECLFAIVDFSLPGENHVRRIISKKNLKDGKINAVIYEGEVGADNLCSKKTNIMTMRDATPEKFWKCVDILSMLYRAAGGLSDIRMYEGKTMSEAADLMRRLDHAKVWTRKNSDPGFQ